MQRIVGLCAGWVGLLVSGGATPGVLAQTPTIDQSLDVQSVSAPKLSPDGRQVVFERSRTNWQANAFETDLWLCDIKRACRQLTASAKSSSDAAWSPDGRWIAFLSDRPAPQPGSPGDKQQLYVMAADGGEAQQVTRLEKGVKAFEWAPDGLHWAVTAEAPDTKALKERKDSFGDYHVFHADYDLVRLWLVARPQGGTAGEDGDKGDPKLLTSGDAFSVGGFSFSPDGRTIAFSAQKDPDLISAGGSAIYSVEVADGAVKVIASGRGPNLNPHWSPNGAQIAYETADGDPYFFYANRKIAVVGRVGGLGGVVNPSFDEDAELLDWSPQGIFFQARQRTHGGLFITDPHARTTRQILLGPEDLDMRFSLSKDFRRAAFVGAGPNRFGEIYVSDLTRPSPLKLTDAGEQLAHFQLAQRQVVHWTASDGAQIEGVLFKPPHFDPAKHYPLLVVIHGGPIGVDTPTIAADRYYPIERFIAKGALVLKPNYRGSAGYGARFRALNVRNLGLGDMDDVVTGVDALIAKGFVDPSRLGAMGWSEGGYISAFITTSSNRFKAVSVGAGISDWATYYANTDITPFAPQYLHATPWDDPEIYRRTSPITYIAKAQTPTLLQHGSLDRRVPIANAFELRQALQDHGVPVKLVVYDGFGHPINKPKQQRAVMEENEGWFAHYIWDEPLAGSLAPRPHAPSPGTQSTP